MVGKYLVVRTDTGTVDRSFDTEIEAWTYIGELEHDECLARPELTYAEAARDVQARYGIYGAVC